MKHLVYLSVLFVALSTSVFASGSEEGNVVKIVSNESKFELKYLTSPQGTVKVNIYDASSKKIYVDVIKANKRFSRPYNFTGAPAGVYTIEVIDGDKVVKQEITYGTLKKDLKVTVNPIAEKKYKLDVLGLDKESVLVSIYDISHKLVYTDEVDVKKSFSRVYDLSKVASNDFYFEVTSSDRIVKQVVNE